MNTTPFGVALNINTIKKELPSIIEVTADDYSLYSNFIQKCTENYYNHTYKFSSEPSDYNDSECFFNWVQSHKIFIVNKDNRNLGYVVVHHNDTAENSVVSFSYFVHPSVCKLNTTFLAVSGLVLSAYTASLYGSKLITSYANHTLLVNVINNIFPETKQYLLQTNLFFVSINLSSLSNNDIDNILYNNFNNESLQQYKKLV